MSFATANRLPTAKVKGPGSDYVGISAQSVTAALAGFSVTGTGGDLAGKLSFDAGSGYPISTVTYVIVCSKAKNASKGKLLKSYLSYALQDGQRVADGLGFAPLPQELLDRAKASVASLA